MENVIWEGCNSNSVVAGTGYLQRIRRMPLQMRNMKQVSFYVVIFLLAFSARLFLTNLSRNSDSNIDLCIYMDSGQLIANGINPYNYNEGKELRQLLRTDVSAYNSYTCLTQDRWNYYASSNLPLTLLYFGAIEYVAKTFAFTVDGYASGILYRIIFALSDSILAVIISAYILKYWKNRSQFYQQFGVYGLGVFNPVLLYHGTIMPEDKGVQVLLMIAALYFARCSNVFCRVVVAAVFTGASIAYKGLGIFIAPLILYYVIQHAGDSFANKVKQVSGFLALCSVFLIVTCLPYASGLLSMMTGRLTSDLTVGAPAHASIWILLYKMFPHHWVLFKTTVIMLCLLMCIWLLFRIKNSFADVSAAMLLIFTNVMLLAGSLNRMNIGLLACLTIIGCKTNYLALLPYYLIAGAYLLLVAVNAYCDMGFLLTLPKIHGISNSNLEYMDSLFALGFTTLFIISLMRSCKGTEGV